MRPKPQQFLNPLISLPVILLLCSQLLVAADAADAVARSEALATDTANYEEQLADLESQFGPYDRSLLEPLQSLTELAVEESDFSRVGELQSRQLQVMRTVLGFRHPDLVPLLQEIVANEIRLQNWEQVTDHLEHIRYLVAGEEEAGEEQNVTTALLEVMDQQVYWHLARVYLDESELRARNFMEARKISADMLKMAETEYGEGSDQLIPWIYQSALNEYRLVELMNADDGIAADTIARLIGEEGVSRLQIFRSTRFDVGNLLGNNNNFIPVVEGDELVGEDYLRSAQNAIKDIGEIATSKGDLEAQGMALIYEGDLQRIMNRSTSLGKYREARERLLEAGVAAESVERFFSQPAIIPLSKMYLRLDEALAYQAQNKQGIENYTGDTLHLGQFMAWQKGLPDVPRPEPAKAFLDVELDYNYVDATVSVSSSGKVSSVEVIAAHPAERTVEREAWRALREVQVRPAIIEGRARRTRDVHVRYLYLATD